MIKSILHTLCFCVLLICLDFSAANAQYYYKDLMSTLQQNKQFAILKNGNIRTIKIESFDENDQPSEGFFCEKKINKSFSQSQMMSKSNITGESLLTTDYNNKGDVVKTTTSTPTTTSTVEFEYDVNGNISLIRTMTKADGDSSSITETHEYFYDNGRPVKMLRKKNNSLISTITFVADAKGNIIEEDPSGNSIDKKYFYYYDDSNRLTDVVHYNVIAKRLLPDYMFEYSDGNLPKQMISVDETGRNYFIWRYAYDDKKLPEIQKCFSKEKQLMGTIQFEYQ
ncbi:MAG: RHS repeat domain-containing protein [Ginsengibacter sp.]